MKPYRKLVEDALAAVSVLSPTSFSWFGSRIGELPAQVAAAMDAATARAYLVHQLQSVLYGNFYCRGEPRPSLADERPAPGFGPSPFVHALSAANGSAGGREAGWTVVGEDGDRLVVERGGLRVWAKPEEVYGAANGPGAAVGVLFPKELLRLSPGFYMALGEAEFPSDGQTPIVRFYWNLESETAVALIRELTARLNEAALAFRLKVVSDPGGYTRCDSGVLYALRSQYDAAAVIVASTYRELAGAMRALTPAFTKTLAPGLGFAEDPPGGATSFGLTRSLALAEGIVAAAEQGRVSLRERFDAVAESFARSGIDLDAPYLNPGSADGYAWPS